MGNECGKIYDCVIVGGGVIGAFVARELMRYSGRFLLLEAGNDVSVGTTKANSGIVHAGFDAAPNTRKAKYNVLGSRLMERKCRELDVPYKRNGALVLAFGNDGDLRKLRARGMTNGVDVEIISGDAARALEPRLSEKATSALFAPSSAIVSPYELAIACCENFTDNGGELKTDTRVNTVRRGARGFWYVETERDMFLTRSVVNAAGLYSDDIHNSACADKLKTTARRGQYMLLDKAALPVERTVFQTPTALGKGVLVAPTCHGNTVIGPSAEDVADRSDAATTADVLDAVFERARLSVPTLSKRDIITQFSGLRAVCGDDFVLGESADGFFDAVGICSPGLASSPAIGEYLAGAVAQKLGLGENKKFEPRREGIFRFSEATDEERARMIERDPSYGRIVCRCETVTEGEIAEAVRRGAVDLDGVKRRVRAGMGRCQAGFCTPNLIKIIARELGISPNFVTKNGGGSTVLWQVDNGGGK